MFTFLLWYIAGVLVTVGFMIDSWRHSSFLPAKEDPSRADLIKYVKESWPMVVFWPAFALILLGMTLSALVTIIVRLAK